MKHECWSPANCGACEEFKEEEPRLVYWTKFLTHPREGISTVTYHYSDGSEREEKVHDSYIMTGIIRMET